MRVSVKEIVCARMVGQQGERERQCPERAGALQELAALDAAVAVLVVEIENLLVDLGLCNGGHFFPFVKAPASCASAAAGRRPPGRSCPPRRIPARGTSPPSAAAP